MGRPLRSRPKRRRFCRSKHLPDEWATGRTAARRQNTETEISAKAQMKVPFLDLKAHHAPIVDEFEGAIREVIESSAFAGGPFVERFEEEFADYCASKYAIGVGNGTDALWLTLLALGIGLGDESHGENQSDHSSSPFRTTGGHGSDFGLRSRTRPFCCRGCRSSSRSQVQGSKSRHIGRCRLLQLLSRKESWRFWRGWRDSYKRRCVT